MIKRASAFKSYWGTKGAIVILVLGFELEM